MGSWFRQEIIENDRLALFLCFLAFVITFVTTRVITRMIRAGRGPFKNNVSTSGLHVHHAVPGLVLLIIGAFVSVGTGSTVPWAEMGAVLVGIGTSLVLDEFALILHLQDVYWSDEGRISVEMVSLAIGCLGLVLVGVNPFSFEGENDLGASARAAVTVVFVILQLGLIIVCVTKGKYKMALFGTFIPFLAQVSAFRLARPESRWATARYGSRKREKAQARAARYEARFGPITDWVGDFVAGKPSEPDPPAPDEQPARIAPSEPTSVRPG
ncbi:MAG: hypothetical protein ACR2HQ_07100 [Ilumatobacteraceae bacterium]